MERSGWTQAETARKLELTPASVSRYISSKDEPSRQTIRLFRLLLTDIPEMIREQAPGYLSEEQVWRERAKRAEHENQQIKSALRQLLQSDLTQTKATNPVLPVNSTADASAAEAGRRAAASARNPIPK